MSGPLTTMRVMSRPRPAFWIRLKPPKGPTWFLLLAIALRGAIGLAAPPPAPSDGAGITVAVTADVYTPGAKLVSDVILARPAVNAVLLAGDTDNATSTRLSGYTKLYKDTFGRFLTNIYPAPGNHDRYSTPPFTGYRTFWGAAAHGPEMYYSFDLGGWHFLSLDSVTYVKGGAAATNQLHWVKADLAAHPKEPVLVFWHYPLFSTAKHLGNARMQSLWTAICDHGPALLITGHNHVYERFAPLDAEGKPAPENQGIQEFVVSPGGASPVSKQSSKAKGPAPVKFHGGASHVGFFTLHTDGGYTYTVIAVDKKGATTVVDSGAGNLLGGPVPTTPSVGEANAPIRREAAFR
jgi:acid phosphatase type 7